MKWSRLFNSVVTISCWATLPSPPTRAKILSRGTGALVTIGDNPKIFLISGPAAIPYLRKNEKNESVNFDNEFGIKFHHQIEYRNPKTGELWRSVPCSPPKQILSRDICVTELPKKDLELKRIEKTKKFYFSPLPLCPDPVRLNTKISIPGFKRLASRFSTDCEEEDDEEILPQASTVIEGKINIHTDDQSFAFADRFLDEGMTGAPVVIYDQFSDGYSCAGIAEGIVPEDEENCKKDPIYRLLQNNIGFMSSSTLTLEIKKLAKFV